MLSHFVSLCIRLNVENFIFWTFYQKNKLGKFCSRFGVWKSIHGKSKMKWKCHIFCENLRHAPSELRAFLRFFFRTFFSCRFSCHFVAIKCVNTKCHGSYYFIYCMINSLDLSLVVENNTKMKLALDNVENMKRLLGFSMNVIIEINVIHFSKIIRSFVVAR